MNNHVHTSLIPFTKNRPPNVIFSFIINECMEKEKEHQERKRRVFTRGDLQTRDKAGAMASRMSFVWCAIALACAAMAATAMAATTHVVGGDEGWKIPTDMSFYATWAADKTFNVGDKLEFKWMGVHNVVEVTKEEYENCTKAGTPHSTSPVTISLDTDTAGSKYFICSVGSHCSLGQKLSVTIGSARSTTTEAPAPSTAPASLLANALSAGMFAVGSIFFTSL